MSFSVKATLEGEVIWAYTWGKKPSNWQLEEVTVDFLHGDPVLKHHINSIYRGVIYLRDEFAVRSVTYQGGLVVELVQ